MQAQPFQPVADLQSWMLDRLGRDQFVVRHGMQEVEVHWNDGKRFRNEEVRCWSAARARLMQPVAQRGGGRQLCCLTAVGLLQLGRRCLGSRTTGQMRSHPSCALPSCLPPSRIAAADAGANIPPTHPHPDRTSQMYKRQGWTETFVQWTPQGNYLITMHRQGVALWAGPEYKRAGRIAHPNVSAAPPPVGQLAQHCWAQAQAQRCAAWLKPSLPTHLPWRLQQQQRMNVLHTRGPSPDPRPSPRPSRRRRRRRAGLAHRHLPQRGLHGHVQQLRAARPQGAPALPAQRL
jgi:hypothetical protein